MTIQHLHQIKFQVLIRLALVRGNDNPALAPDQISSTDQTSTVRGNDNPALAPEDQLLADLESLDQLLPTADTITVYPTVYPTAPPLAREDISGQISSSCNESLPANWEMSHDQYGRVYYIDHLNHCTQWERPTATIAATAGQSEESEQRRHLLHYRYQSVGHALVGRRQEAAAVTPEALPSVSISADAGLSENNREMDTILPIIGSQATLLPQSVQSIPAVRFLTQVDLMVRIRENRDADRLYQTKAGLREIIMKIRQAPATFPRYQYNRDLADFLNCFADTLARLPPGWERRYNYNDQRVFFLNHNTSITTYIDPRLPGGDAAEEPTLRSQLMTASALAAGSPRLARRHSGAHGHAQGQEPQTTESSDPQEEQPLSYNERVVSFFKQPDIENILLRKLPGISRTVLNTARNIAKRGSTALAYVANDVDFILLLSSLEDDILSYVPNAQPEDTLSTFCKYCLLNLYTYP
jgi:hypothetical protein